MRSLAVRYFRPLGRGHGIDGHHEQRTKRESGERAGQESGRAEREFDCGPGGAGGSGREHEKAAEPKPKTPDVDLGV